MGALHTRPLFDGFQLLVFEVRDWILANGVIEVAAVAVGTLRYQIGQANIQVRDFYDQ